MSNLLQLLSGSPSRGGGLRGPYACLWTRHNVPGAGASAGPSGTPVSTDERVGGSGHLGEPALADRDDRGDLPEDRVGATEPGTGYVVGLCVGHDLPDPVREPQPLLSLRVRHGALRPLVGQLGVAATRQGGDHGRTDVAVESADRLVDVETHRLGVSSCCDVYSHDVPPPLTLDFTPLRQTALDKSRVIGRHPKPGLALDPVNPGLLHGDDEVGAPQQDPYRTSQRGRCCRGPWP